MVDYKITKGFDIETNEWNDIRQVDGREEFEQSLIVNSTIEMEKLIGSSDSSNSLKERIKLVANRVAEKYGIITKIENIDISRTQSDSLKISVYYVTGSTFSETI